MLLISKQFLACGSLVRGFGFFFAIVLSWGLAITSASSAGLEVKDIRVGVYNGTTRFVVDLSDKVEPRVFLLPDPFRVVIDLPEVNFVLLEERIGDGAGLIEQLRYGLFRPGTSRFVLDLNMPSKISKQFLLRPSGTKPWRLVLDIVPTSRANFIASMRPSGDIKPRVASKPPAPLNRLQNAKPVVVIDAGHGGVDPGAIGVSGAYEKTIALNYSLDVAKRLRATGRYKVVMTRDRDIFLPLRERVRIARAANADLFLSLHANTHPKRSTNGFSVYTLSNRASDKEAAALAALENKSDVIGGVDLDDYSDDVQNILIDFAQAKTNELSVKFARDMLVGEIGQRARLLGRPWRSAGFAVLKAPDVPSVLLELGYISNPKEEKLLFSKAHKEKMSAAIVRAVGAYFKSMQNARP
jgi:N-acetylmuramoyl-L-alanine amidase